MDALLKPTAQCRVAGPSEGMKNGSLLFCHRLQPEFVYLPFIIGRIVVVGNDQTVLL